MINPKLVNKNNCLIPKDKSNCPGHQKYLNKKMNYSNHPYLKGFES